MPFVRCPTPADAQAALDRVVAARGEALFLFFGSEDPGTGASWCADCVTADPVLRATLAAAAPTLTVYECPVGERSAWKGQMQHPYRVHPAFHLARIPTVIRFQAGIDIGRLVEASCADRAAVTAFVS